MKFEALKTHLETHYKLDVCAIPGDGIRVCDFGDVFAAEGSRFKVVCYVGPQGKAKAVQVMNFAELTEMLGDAFYLRRLAEIESEFF